MANFSRGMTFKIGWENLQESVLRLAVTQAVRMLKIGLKFPRLKLSSCSRERLFKRICSGSRAEISVRLAEICYIQKFHAVASALVKVGRSNKNCFPCNKVSLVKQNFR